jgi:DNA topoisomerase-3
LHNKLSLVVAEKPSVAKSIADVLGAKSRRDGSYEGNGYVVSWCVGHLLGLAEPHTYDEKYAKWRYEDLPIAPAEWKYTPASGTKKQLKILVDLMKRSDVGTIINACDSGREGELIFRLVYNHAKCKKPIKRLWISSMEESAISDGFRNLKDGADYDSLYHSAMCRQQADWLVGLNYSRLFSVLYNARLRVGRVQTPTLAMIVTREQLIRLFKKEPFYVVGVSDGSFTAEREKVKDKAAAEAIAAACDGKTAVVKSVQRQEKSVSAPKLYDLTTLQREANRLFGYTATQTLNAVQNLYEQKITTYPRTDSRFVTEDMAEGIPALVQSSIEFLGMPVLIHVLTKQIVNNSKVTDHHAIIPTPTAAKADISKLPTTERNILMMLCARLVSAVTEKHIYSETVVTLDCGGEVFTAKGKIITQSGWKEIEQAFLSSIGKNKKDEDKPLPDLSEGQSITVNAAVREGFSQPPKHYNEDALLASMETAGAEDMPDNMERKGLGTPATRAAIIEGLVKSGLVVRKDKNILPTEKGENLIRVLPDSVKSPLLTAEWEHFLKGIERGEMSADDYMLSINRYVADTVKAHNAVPDELKALFPSAYLAGGSGEVIGKCPRCGGKVAETPKAFSCENTRNKKCGFALFKDNRFFTTKKKAITKDVATALLNEGRIFMSGLHSEKTGNAYNATIILDDKGEGYPSFKLEFESKGAKSSGK